MTHNADLIDTTLRDGNQSLWATRMTTDTMLPILPTMDRAGYHSIELMASVHMDVCVRFLAENPWDRIRRVRHQVKRTPLRMLGMSNFFSISRVLPDEVVELYHETCARAGIEHLWVSAAMNDVRTAEVGIASARAAGCRVDGALQFTVSPVHTDAFFVQTARELLGLGIEALIVKDAGGLLTPERVASLVPALTAVTGDTPVYVHSHCVTGMGPATEVAAVEHGATAVWTCTTPLANGTSLPSDESLVRNLAWRGVGTKVDLQALGEVNRYFTDVAGRLEKPVGAVAEFDTGHYAHQMPGGMLTNFKAQLAEVGMSDKFQAVMDEMPRVRMELGYPNVQTPFSQFIGTQSLLNVLHGRYEVIPDEVRNFVLGYWGRTPAPIDPDVLDRVAGGREPVSARPGSMVEPVLDRVRRDFGPFHTDEELLLATLFMPEVLEDMRARQRELARGPGVSLARCSSIADLVDEASKVPGIKHVHLAYRPSGG
jgi:oxaloacetate decarboxylase alpha subunit